MTTVQLQLSTAVPYFDVSALQRQRETAVLVIQILFYYTDNINLTVAQSRTCPQILSLHCCCTFLFLLL